MAPNTTHLRLNLHVQAHLLGSGCAKARDVDDGDDLRVLRVARFWRLTAAQTTHENFDRNRTATAANISTSCLLPEEGQLKASWLCTDC